MQSQENVSRRGFLKGAVAGGAALALSSKLAMAEQIMTGRAPTIESIRGIGVAPGMVRMNLNSFQRHGVFEVKGMTQCIARKLRDPAAIAQAKVFPYQLLMAFKAASQELPEVVVDALQDAMELATENVPAISGKVFICPDVSGSMQCAVTGHRSGATSKVRCVDVAALVAAVLLRKNRSAEVIPFEGDVVKVRLNARDSVMTNSEKLAAIGGGATDCSAPLRMLNKRQAKGDLVIFVSDNESWLDGPYSRGTRTLGEWQDFKSRNPQARLVCLDVQPYGTTQAQDRADILNVGGFSDRVFSLIDRFARGALGADHWVGEIESVALEAE